MMAHTPGSWTYNERVKCIAAPAGWVASLVGHRVGDQKADGILMASAPDLLEACEAAIEALDACADYVTSSVYAQIWSFCNGYEGSPDIRAIVAKAKGE